MTSKAGGKARAAGVSATSFLDLKAELAKKEDEFARSKASGTSRAIIGGVKRPEKKVSVWAKQNRGVRARSARDVELEEVSKPTLESARAALERKAAVYEKLRRGKSGGLNDKQYESLLVDFDQKAMDNGYRSDSSDEDESLTVPKGPLNSNDSIIEYEDEFGRIRTAPRSEIPRELLPKEHREEELDDFDPYVIRNARDHFPVYEQTPERLAQLAEEAKEADNPLAAHYDATHEVRNKGAAFYRFSGDEEERARQMEELKAARGETEKTRQDMGAEDVKVGEVEGMRAGEGEGGGGDDGKEKRSRAMEKRKRELEERRRKVDEKRRKIGKGPAEMSAAEQSSASTPAIIPPILSTSNASVDPFTALEASARQLPSLPKERTNADDFLAALEREMLAGKQS